MKQYLFKYKIGNRDEWHFKLVYANDAEEAEQKLKDAEKSRYHYGDAYAREYTTAHSIINCTIE